MLHSHGQPACRYRRRAGLSNIGGEVPLQEGRSVVRKEKLHNPTVFFILFIAAIVVVGIIANLLTDNTFLDIKNLKVIVSASIYPSFIAWGLCFLFAAGYYDLSIGSIIVLASFASCILGNIYGYPGVIVGGMLVGTFLVFFNSLVFVITKVPTWIASLSLTLVYEALAIYLRQNKTSRPYIDAELNISYRALGQIPWNLIVLAIGFVIVYVVYNRTNIGLKIRAIGGNREVSRTLGVNTNRVLLMAGLICGLLIGFSSVIQQSYNVRTTVMTSLTSLQMMFKPLAIALLAQTLQKRISIIIVVPFCSILIYSVFNLLTFFHVPSGTLQEVFLCVFIILFGMLGQRGVKEVVK